MTHGNDAEQFKKALAELASAQTQHLNRQLALEAFAHSLVLQLNPAQAAAVLDEYEQGLDRIAHQVPPRQQRPALWDDLKHALEDRCKRPAQPPGRSS